jgi:hypothetical protein
MGIGSGYKVFFLYHSSVKPGLCSIGTGTWMLPYLLHILQVIPLRFVHELAIFVIFAFAINKHAAIASVNLFLYILLGKTRYKQKKNNKSFL